MIYQTGQWSRLWSVATEIKQLLYLAVNKLVVLTEAALILSEVKLPSSG